MNVDLMYWQKASGSDYGFFPILDTLSTIWQKWHAWAALGGATLKKKGSVPLTYNPKPAGKYHSELDYRFWLRNLKKKVADLRKLVADWQDIEFW